jgi:hypothetical protein
MKHNNRKNYIVLAGCILFGVLLQIIAATLSLSKLISGNMASEWIIPVMSIAGIAIELVAVAILVFMFVLRTMKKRKEERNEDGNIAASLDFPVIIGAVILITYIIVRSISH